MNPSSSMSLEEILKAGEDLYLNKFREKLEKSHNGEYAVIDVEEGRYVVLPSKLEAIDKARADFGQKLFYIVQVGSIDRPTINQVTKQYAWTF